MVAQIYATLVFGAVLFAFGGALLVPTSLKALFLLATCFVCNTMAIYAPMVEGQHVWGNIARFWTLYILEACLAGMLAFSLLEFAFGVYTGYKFILSNA